VLPAVSAVPPVATGGVSDGIASYVGPRQWGASVSDVRIGHRGLERHAHPTPPALEEAHAHVPGAVGGILSHAATRSGVLLVSATQLGIDLVLVPDPVPFVGEAFPHIREAPPFVREPLSLIREGGAGIVDASAGAFVALVRSRSKPLQGPAPGVEICRSLVADGRVAVPAFNVDMVLVGHGLALVGGRLVLYVDARLMTFVDSSGVSALVVAHQLAERAGTRLVLESPSDAMQRTLQTPGLLAFST